MKILLLCFSKNNGGMEFDAVRICRRISRYSEVTLLGALGSPIEQMAFQDKLDGYMYSFIGCNFTRFLSRALFDPRICHAVRSEVIKNNPDLIIFYGTSEIKSISLALCGLKNKLILRLGTTINKPKSSWFQKIAYSRVDAFLATSEHIKLNIIKSFPVAAERPVEICYPVVSCKFSQSSFKNISDGINIIYHSRFVRGKGQLDAVRAFHLAQDDNSSLHLTLVGSYEDRTYVDELKQYIDDHRLSSKISVLPNTDNIDQFLMESHIFLAPSYGEGFSNSFAEAMSHGLICVVYDNTALHYFKGQGFEYFMVPTGDIAALSQALTDAVRALYKSSVNVEKNKQLVKQLFSLENERSTLETLYYKLT